MIQKAIIESIIDNYTVKVRIPKYDKMYTDGLKFNELSTGIICVVPGTNVHYSVNDVVLVGFENDEIGKPVILGLLYTDKKSDSSVNILQVDNIIDKVSTTLNDMASKNYYTHIKYSNDGGITFTSLYDYLDTSNDNGTFYCKNILIDKKSTFIKWDIVDNNNQNCVDKFDLKVVIHNGDNIIESSEVITDIPDIYNFADKLTIDYYITPIDVDINDYNIALYTDKNSLGSVEGDYIGIYNSDSYIPSLNPIEYSWLSIKVRIEKFFEDFSSDMLERVRLIERYLYGKTSEENESENDQLGINSAVQVTKDQLNISLKDKVKLSSNIYIDTKHNSIFFNNVAIVAGKNGHLTIK